MRYNIMPIHNVECIIISDAEHNDEFKPLDSAAMTYISILCHQTPLYNVAFDSLGVCPTQLWTVLHELILMPSEVFPYTFTTFNNTTSYLG